MIQSHVVQSKKSLSALHLKKSVLDIVSEDLNFELNKSNHPSKKLRLMAEKTGIHQKTLLRICKKENSPSYLTVFKIYKYIFNLENDSDVIAKCPEIIKNYLVKINPQTFEKNKNYSSGLNKSFINNPIFMQIYILCGTGPVKKSEIQKKFGQYGLEIAQQMISEKILIDFDRNHFSLGQQLIHMTPDYILKSGVLITENFFKIENCGEQNHNFIGFFAEGLSEDGYKKWLEIDQTAFNQKADLAKNNNYLGPRRAFTFMATDDLTHKDTL